MGTKVLNICGERYGRLVAIKRVSSRKQSTFWLFKCDCGAQKEISLTSVRRGHSKSCGCLNIDSLQGRAVHGMRKLSSYTVWQSMKERCYNKNYKSYMHYGGRGISVCDRWRNSFVNFFEDMGDRPNDKSLDRIDNDGNYEPSNCRWTSKKVQRQNQRGIKLYPFENELLTIAEIARRSGVTYENLFYRISQRKCDPEYAVKLLREGKWRRA